jgi:hypothetical protein
MGMEIEPSFWRGLGLITVALILYNYDGIIGFMGRGKGGEKGKKD